VLTVTLHLLFQEPALPQFDIQVIQKTRIFQFGCKDFTDRETPFNPFKDVCQPANIRFGVL
jgi:hypothetical protein